MNLLTAEHLKKSYTERLLFDDVAFSIGEGDKIGLIGINGTGKSTFIKILMGQVKPDSGTVDIGETVRFGYYSQDGLQFDEQMKVIDVIQDIAEVIELGNGKKLTASQFLQHFLFTPETQHSYVYKLSGGERRRLYLCTILMRNPNFLVLDEPTNDLDIITLNVLEEYLQNFKGCVIVVSHDRYFINSTASRILELVNQTFVNYIGNYDYYLEKKDELTQTYASSQIQRQVSTSQNGSETLPADGAFLSDSKLSWQEQKEQQAKERKRKSELKKTEDEIALLENRNGEIDFQMTLEEVYSNSVKCQELSTERTKNELRLEELYEKWGELAE